MNKSISSPHQHRRKDLRLQALTLVVLGTTVLGYLVTLLPAQQSFQPVKQRIDVGIESESRENVISEAILYPALGPGEEAGDLPARMHLGEVRQLLDAKQFDQAYESLNRVRNQVQHIPESLLLMGEALLGRKDYTGARDFFNAAIDRKPALPDAYFGLAMAAEGLGDLEQALGGMRSYLHMQTDPDPYQLKVAQARSAIWEWESQLGRGAWGTSKGIPPGFTADEIKRDGRGVGTKMPVIGTENEKGFSQYEIRHSDKIEMFER